MNKQELKQQARKEFEKFWDNQYTLEGLPETKDKIKSFIDSIIDKTVQQTEWRILDIVRFSLGKDSARELEESLIPNENDIIK